MPSSDVKVTKSDYGYWVTRNGRSRFVLATAEEMAVLNLEALERTRRAFAEGTHEPVVFYRDHEGVICLPPTPDSPIPTGCQREYVNTLAGADKLCAEVRADLESKYRDHGAFTEMMEENLGNPRKQLIDRMAVTHSNLERDTIRLLLKDMDKQEAQRESMRVDARFGWRES